MKIKVAFLDGDTRYLEKLMSAFLKDYFDKVEIYSFTVYEKAIESISKERINVFLTTTEFAINAEDIPADCEVAYLVDSRGIDTYKGVKAICKFQPVEVL